MPTRHTMATKTPANARQRLIKLIHVGRRELGMDEPTYRTMLRATGKAESTSAMAVPALMAVLERMKAAGFTIRPKNGDRQMAANPEAKKVRALWLFLHHLGEVRDPSETALAAYVKRMVKVDDLRWARGDRVAYLIETLKKWVMRRLPGAVHQLKLDAIEERRAGRLTPAQVEDIHNALDGLSGDSGFDKHWASWEGLTLALGRPILADIKVLGSAKA